MLRSGLSIRYKTVLLVAVVLVVTMAVYLYLAIELFRRDKLAYVFDVSSAVTRTFAEETSVQFSFFGSQLRRVGSAILAAGDDVETGENAANALFAAEPELVRLEVFEGDAASARPMFLRVNPDRLADMSITLDDLATRHRNRPVPLSEVANADLHLQNGSIPPDAGILTVAVPLRQDEREEPVGFVVADVRQDRLLRVLGRAEAQTTYLVDGDGVVVVHPDASLVVEEADFGGRDIVRAALDGAFPQGVREFVDDDGRAFLGAFTRLEAAGAAVVSEVPRDEALRAADQLVRRSALFGVALVLVAIIVGIFFSRRLTEPLRRLRTATHALGQGDFDVEIDVSSTDEIGDLASDFQKMAQSLKEAQAGLIQSEKLAAFGQLGAGVTHEVKNPLTGVIGFLQLALEDSELPANTRDLLERTLKQARRCLDIIENFLRFARAETSDVPMERLDLRDVVRDGVSLVTHQLNIGNVQVKTELTEDALPVLARPGQLQQVLLNLFLNAQQAMPDGGVVTARVARQDGHGVIEVQDDGPGIPPEVAARVFEPFFTTKSVGHGTGLGLAVSYGIVSAHGGSISVESAPGAGSTFRIRMPLAAG